MASLTLDTAVSHFAALTHAFSEADLEQQWAWLAHEEGVRFAFLGTYQELRDLAARLAVRRQTAGPPLTIAHRVLGQYLAAYRDFQAVMLGVSDDDYEREPAPAEWPLRLVVGHTLRTHITFFALTHYGLERLRSEEERPLSFPPEEVGRVVVSPEQIHALIFDKSRQEVLAFYDNLHQRTLAEFAGMSDAESQGPSLWWEGEPYTLQHRLHRFDAHLRQHTIQVEKALELLGQPATEAKKLLRLVYQALAEVEAAVLGAPDLGVAERQALAQTIQTRAEEVAGVVTQCRAMSTAVAAGNLAEVQRLLTANPQLANVLEPQRIPVLFTALYRGYDEIATALQAAGATLDLFAATAVGRLDLVQQELADYPEDVNEYSRDGFTPLQLACYFGHEEMALWLIDHGADVQATAKNDLKIQPIHAAAANGSLLILRALLAAGADANARQQQDFTPLHTAADRDDIPMARLLLAHGANLHAQTAAGQTPLDLAQARGQQRVAAYLQDPS
ncbi:MAG: ankyrin repeat domain-containing protein [Ardenticatenaceae bacterium]|nr:ankyrin repeat domain-containing protein [Ardenticatenaceae bacterium]